MELVDALVAGVASAAAWPTCGFLLIGTLVGAVVGLLPGLGAPAMLTLMVPFTIAMDPLPAMAMLMSAAAVTATTGDLSSILLGVPGEAVSAAMVVDGHAMAKRGEAGRALGAALMSSLLGAMCGVVAFVLAIPVARPLLTSIGSPELFMLTIAGIAFIAPLVGRSPLKGVIAGGIGLLLATVGLDSMDATPRFTFGSLALWDGLGVLPVVLGLFAIPEALLLMSPVAHTSPLPLPDRGGVMRGMRDTLRRWPLVLRCSAIGTYIGMLPGPGGSIAQWVAYAHAIGGRSAARADDGGRIEGVIGPGAANNSALGGALIPTIVLGIPGSITTAILLSALAIKSISPGDGMLRAEQAGGHLGFVMALMVFVVVSNVLVVGLFAGLIGPLSRIADVRGALLAPAVLLLTCVGAFMERNVMVDLLIVGASGALGWAMVRFDWPRAPLLLGLILGPLAENRLFLSIGVYGSAWWQRPAVLLIGVAVAAGAGFSVWRRAQRRAADARPDREDESPTGSRSIGDLIFCAAVAIVSVAGLAAARDFGARAGLFPRVILVALLVFAILQLVVEWRARAGRPAVDTGDAVAPLWIVAFFVAVWMLGFDAGAAVAALAYLVFGARERWRVAVPYALMLAFFVIVVLEQMLAVPLPRGMLFAGFDR